MSGSRNAVLIALAITVGLGVTGAVLSPENIVQILGFCSIISTSLISLIKQDESAMKVDRVALGQEISDRNTALKLSRLEGVTDQIHTLTNNTHGIALLAIVTGLEEVVELAQDPARKASAERRLEDAKKVYDEHMAKQKVVDLGKRTT